METARDGKRIFIWHGRDLAEDSSRLACAVAESCVAKLFEVDGGLVWLKDDGQLAPVGRSILHGIISTFIAGQRLVNHGTTEVPKWEVEFYSFGFPPGADTSKEPNDKVLTRLSEHLLQQVAKGPSAAPKLSTQQRQEISDRLRMGEPEDRVAAAYKIDIGTVRQLARAG